MKQRDIVLACLLNLSPASVLGGAAAAEEANLKPAAKKPSAKEMREAEYAQERSRRAGRRTSSAGR